MGLIFTNHERDIISSLESIISLGFYIAELFPVVIHYMLNFLDYMYLVLKPQESSDEFDNFSFLELQKVQEIIRKHHQTFLQ